MKNRNNKNLDNGEVIPSSCGNMQNENLIYIFHAVGPYYFGGERNERFELMLTFQSCIGLAEAAEFSVESISIPPISTGLFGYPIYDCAKVFYGCISELVQDKIANKSKVCLKEIRMVIIDDKTFNPFKDELDLFKTEIKSTNLATYICEEGYIEFGLKNAHILKKFE
jgi:putative ATPase